MHNIRFFVVSTLLLVASASLGQDTLTVMNWNVLNYTSTDASRDPYYRTVIRHVEPDVIVVEEMTTGTSIDAFYSRVVNVVYPGQFATGPFTFIGGDTYNGIYYKPAKFAPVTNTPIRTALRDISEFKLYNAVAADTFRIYALHLKASSGSANEIKRAAEVDSLRKVTNTLSNGKYYIVAGDFNIYGSTEPAYTKLLLDNPTDDGHFVDTIHITGTWNNSSYAQHHTQSPRVRAFGGGATGGMDDRFDMILFSRAVAEGNGKISYLANSMTAIGNDGAHYNDSINRLPNTAVPDSVAHAVHYGSDHLPISARFIFRAGVTSFSITATAGANGIILPNGIVQVDSGTNKTFTISPSSGFLLSTLLVDGVSVTPVLSYDFTDITSNHMISATFSPAPVTQEIMVSDGWNIVSVPLSVSNKSKDAIFPTADSYAFAFLSDSGYQRSDSLHNGFGYWLRFDSSQDIPITGFVRSSDTATVQTGWNLFGSTSMPVSVAAIQEIPAGIISSLIYEYQGNQYSPVDTLFPGKGYWVKSASAGILVLSGSLAPRTPGD